MVHTHNGGKMQLANAFKISTCNRKLPTCNTAVFIIPCAMQDTKIIATPSYSEEHGTEVILTVECDKDYTTNYMCAVTYPASSQLLL